MGLLKSQSIGRQTIKAKCVNVGLGNFQEKGIRLLLMGHQGIPNVIPKSLIVTALAIN